MHLRLQILAPDESLPSVSFRHTTLFDNAETFWQLLDHRCSTLPSSIVHFGVGLNDFPYQSFTPRAHQIGVIPRLPALRYLKFARVDLPQNTLRKCLNASKTITVLEIMFVRLPTCGALLDILAATPSLESMMLSEIYWKHATRRF